MLTKKLLHVNPFPKKRPCLLLSLIFPTVALPSPKFDFDNGNAPYEVILPTVVPVIYETISPTASDPTLILREAVLVETGWFDSMAPYHPSAVGVYSKFNTRFTEKTNKNKNIAIFYSSYRILNNLFPKHKKVWDNMLTSVGLDPSNDSKDPTTPIGIGNIAGNSVIANRIHDGMNQLGDEGKRTYNQQPYADYTNYKPVNTAYDLINPSRWQPNIVSNGYGTFQVQQFITPQLRLTKPFSYKNPERFKAPFPYASQVTHRDEYKQQADEVLYESANLTDEKKLKAEFFNNKIESYMGKTIGDIAYDFVQDHIDGKVGGFNNADYY